MNNHGLAVGISEPTDRRPLLAGVSLPTLVIHGTEDPILPYPHGQALADTIPGARLLTLEKAGHEMPVSREDEIVSAILNLV
jgi:pimeloyl-ACP methyl ester carboxylesterase